jgi:hypothetical protein
MQAIPNRPQGFSAAKSAMTKMPKGPSLTAHKATNNNTVHTLYSQSHMASAGSQQPKLPEQLQMEIIQHK